MGDAKETIERLACVECRRNDDFWADMKPRPNGEFVRYADHAAALARARQEALLEAATVCDGLPHNGLASVRLAHEECASALRALAARRGDGATNTNKEE